MYVCLYLIQEEEMEMGDATKQQYGAEAGYTEEYGTVKPADLQATDDQGYGTMNPDQSATNGGQPVNPFTQQQYADQPKNSNPFKQ